MEDVFKIMYILKHFLWYCFLNTVQVTLVICGSCISADHHMPQKCIEQETWNVPTYFLSVLVSHV
jgi:hypothetical protein